MGTEPCLQPGIPLTPAQLWSPATCAHRHNRALAYMGGLMTTIVSSCLHLPILRVQALFPTALDFLRVGGISDSIIKAKGERESSPPRSSPRRGETLFTHLALFQVRRGSCVPLILSRAPANARHQAPAVLRPQELWSVGRDSFRRAKRAIEFLYNRKKSLPIWTLM